MLTREMMIITRIKPTFGNRVLTSRNPITLRTNKAYVREQHIGRDEMKTSFEKNEILKNIDDLVKSKPVVIFIKGTKTAPECGFSMSTLKILKAVGLEDIECVNVLEKEEIRSGIKKYTSWPTIPQLFLRGKFLGGYDILLSMFKSGELMKLLQEEGVLKKKDS